LTEETELLNREQT